MDAKPATVDVDSLPAAHVPWEVDRRFHYISVGGPAEERVNTHLGLTPWAWAAKVGAGEQAAARIREVFESRQAFANLRYNMDRVDGQIWPLCQSGSPIEDAAGRFAGFRGVLLFETTGAATATVETIRALPVGAAIWDRFGRLVATNDLMAQILNPVAKHLAPGISHADLASFIHRAANPAASVNEIERVMTEAVESFDRKIARETTIFGRWYRLSHRSLADGSTLTCATDVTELKQTELNLRRAEERARSIIAALRESEERLSDSQRIAHVGTFERDLATNEVVWTEEAFRLLGWEPGSVKPGAEPFRARVHPDDVHKVAAVRETVDRGQEPGETQFRVVSPDGLVRVINMIVTILRDANGTAVRSRGTFQDISERFRAESELRRREEELAKSNAILSTVIDTLSEAVSVVRRDGSEVLRNRAAEKLRFPAPGPGLPIYDDDGNAIADSDQPRNRTLATGETIHGVRMHYSDESTGQHRVVSVNAGIGSPTDRTEDDIVVVSTTDVTDGEAAKRELRDSEAFYRSVLENASEGVVIRRMDGSLLLANDAARRMYPDMPDRLEPGYRVPDIGFFTAGGGELPPARMPMMRALYERETVTAFLLGQTNKAGRIGWFSQNTSLLTHPGETEPFAAVLSLTEVTDLVFQQALVEERTDQTKTILRHLVDGVVVIDEAGTIENFNKSAERQFGYTADEAVGQNVRMLMPEPYHSEHDGYLERFRATGESKIIGIGREVVGRRKSGATFPLRLSIGKVKGAGRTFFVGTIHDLTDERAREEQLAQAQKMEAVGQLTGGIAHDFNNMMAIARLHLEFAQDRIADDRQLRGNIGAAMKAIDRSTDLTHRLMAFSRRQTLRPGSVSIPRLVGEMLEFLRRSLGETVEIGTDLPADLWEAKADAGQLEAALLNLALNARDAMPDGGTLTIAASNVGGAAARVGTENGGDYVLIEVRDTGHGLAPDHLVKAFEPFFTTKDVGEGTGLGLSMVYGFAKQSGGHAAIDSEEGAGTTVKLYLPRAPQEERPIGAAPAAGRHADRGQGETILLVEDEAELLDGVGSLLRDLRYRVIPTATARQALDALDENPDIDLLFTDVILPGGMSGRDLAHAVLEKRPGIKVLFMSGYIDCFHDGSAQDQLNLIRKPFGKDQIAKRVRETMRARVPRPGQRLAS